MGQVENSEVRKPKYEVRRNASYWCLVPYWLSIVYVCWGLLGKRWLYLCDVWATLASRTAVSVTITNYVCIWQPDHTKTNGEWANHAGSMLLNSLNSDADASVVIVLHQWLNQLRNYTPEIRSMDVHQKDTVVEIKIPLYHLYFWHASLT